MILKARHLHGKERLCYLSSLESDTTKNNRFLIRPLIRPPILNRINDLGELHIKVFWPG